MRALLLVMWFLHWLPLPILGRLGEQLGSLIFVLTRSRRQIAITNLGLCFPHWSDQRRREISNQHFQAYTRTMLERSILW